ncbi:Uu.00g122020.m01.CDS01 [Anthostomella pinea]|uniref:Uu.00g122020.m01.CDS01 n=1 Tax=Anthostomella pinea TaxID=933095 RepID=A0AAI8VH16_9PEZI|nr:Uu.00g122020.m01.CDS01 [Anthostomella pinea]
MAAPPTPMSSTAMKNGFSPRGSCISAQKRCSGSVLAELTANAIKEEETFVKGEHHKAQNDHIPASYASHSATMGVLGMYWRDLVIHYSRLNLTHDSDRLAALHGIQTLLKERRSDRYLSGLWSGSLVRDMLWWVYWTKPTTKTKRGLFPSWSWASVRSPVEYEDMVDGPGYIKVTFLEETESTLAMMGQLLHVRMRYVPHGIPMPNELTLSHPRRDRREVSMRYTLECLAPAFQGHAFLSDPDYIPEDMVDEDDGSHIVHGQELSCL